MTIGDKIKELRKENNWSQDDLAEKINSEKSHISKYETGKLIPSPAIILKLAEVFNVSSDYLLTDKQVKTPFKHKYDESFLAKLEEIEEISQEDKNALLTFLDAIIAKNKLEKIYKSPKVKDIFKKE